MTHSPVSRQWPRLLALAAMAACAGRAGATPITVDQPYQWLEDRSTNTLGITPGTLQAIGANSVVPNGLGGTTATATQGSTVLNLPFDGSSAINNEFNRTFLANPARYGSWTLKFTNGTNTTTVTTPAIDPAVAIPPFVDNVRITSTSQNAASFSWGIPSSAIGDTVRVNLYDHGSLNLAGTGANDVYNYTFAPGTTALTLPTLLANGQPLKVGDLYTMEINLLRYDGSGTSQTDLETRSRLYVDFLPTTTPTQGAYIPVVEPGVNGSTPIFHFDVSSVGAALQYFDPEIATGYVYKTGAGDPNFASVLLPADIGDGLYQIRLADGSLHDVVGGTTFTFATGGVSQFEVLGIEASAGLNVSDPRAFLTGLTFTSAGQFTGTMQALTVPEAPTWPMLSLGIGMLALVRRWRRRG